MPYLKHLTWRYARSRTVNGKISFYKTAVVLTPFTDFKYNECSKEAINHFFTTFEIFSIILHEFFFYEYPTPQA